MPNINIFQNIFCENTEIEASIVSFKNKDVICITESLQHLTILRRCNIFCLCKRNNWNALYYLNSHQALISQVQRNVTKIRTATSRTC